MENFATLLDRNGQEVLRINRNYFIAYGDHSRIIGNVDGKSVEVSGFGSAFCGLWDTVSDTLRSVKNVDDVALDWLHDHAKTSDLCWRDYITSLLRLFNENASHVSYCFTDTHSYCKSGLFLKEELESAIVRMVVDLD